MNNIVRVLSVSPVQDRGALRAFVEIQVGGFSIADCRIIKENGKKAWVSMPVLAYKSEYGTTNYKPLVRILNKDLKNEITQAVLRAWEENGRGAYGHYTDS